MKSEAEIRALLDEQVLLMVAADMNIISGGAQAAKAFSLGVMLLKWVLDIEERPMPRYGKVELLRGAVEAEGRRLAAMERNN